MRQYIGDSQKAENCKCIQSSEYSRVMQVVTFHNDLIKNFLCDKSWGKEFLLIKAGTTGASVGRPYVRYIALIAAKN